MLFRSNFSKLPKARGSSSFTGFPKSRNPRDSELPKARSSGSFTDLPKSRDPRDSDHVLDHILESDSSDESRPLGTQRQECGSATGSRGFFFRRDPSPLAASRSSPLTPCLTSHPLQSPPISSDLVFRRLLPALLAAPCKYYTCLLACLLARSLLLVSPHSSAHLHCGHSQARRKPGEFPLLSSPPACSVRANSYKT